MRSNRQRVTRRRVRLGTMFVAIGAAFAVAGCASPPNTASPPNSAAPSTTAASSQSPAITDGPDGGHYVDVNGIHVYFKDRGTGPVLLLLHGGLDSQANWEPIAPELAKQFRVITPDTRGQGRSSIDDTPLSYRLFADDASQLLTALNIPKAIVVGHSDGGNTALEMGLHHPDQVAGLVVMGTPYNVSNYYPGVLDELKTMAPDPQYWDPSASTYKTRAEYDAFFHRLVNVMWGVEPNMTLAEVHDITAPTLVLHASDDEYFGAVNSQEMAKAMPNATFELVPKSGHEFMKDNPSFVLESVESFADRINAGATSSTTPHP